MKLVITNHYDIMLSKDALLKARSLGAPWAEKKYMPMVDELDREEYIFYSEEFDKDNEKQHVFFSFDDGEKELYCASHHIPRNDIYLLKLFEEMGGDLSDGTYKFFLVEVPDDICYYVSSDNNGDEIVVEASRSWNKKGECFSYSGSSFYFTKNSMWTPHP